MNLFVTSPNPYECAIALDDKRLNKMCTETAQILSTALWHRGFVDPNLYKPVMVNHPIVLWATEKDENLWFTWNMLFNLSRVYVESFNKIHEATRKLDLILHYIDNLPFSEPLSFHNSARNLSLNLDFTHIPDVCEAYRAYLNVRWKTDKREPKWTNREPPKWKE